MLTLQRLSRTEQLAAACLHYSVRVRLVPPGGADVAGDGQQRSGVPSWFL